jgi:hypothetical protein
VRIILAKSKKTIFLKVLTLRIITETVLNSGVNGRKHTVKNIPSPRNWPYNLKFLSLYPLSLILKTFLK